MVKRVKSFLQILDKLAYERELLIRIAKKLLKRLGLLELIDERELSKKFFAEYTIISTGTTNVLTSDAQAQIVRRLSEVEEYVKNALMNMLPDIASINVITRLKLTTICRNFVKNVQEAVTKLYESAINVITTSRKLSWEEKVPILIEKECEDSYCVYLILEISVEFSQIRVR